MAKKPMDYAINEYRPYGILISGHYKERQEYLIHRPSGSVDWLLMYTLSGTGEVFVCGEAVTCIAGDVTILLPGIPHHYRTAGSHWEFIWVHFIPDPEWSPWLRLPELFKGFIHMELTDINIQNSVKDALVKMQKHDIQGKTVLHNRLSLIALEEALLHLRLAVTVNPYNSMDPRIAEVVHHLRHSYRDRISLPELSRMSCLSTSRLSHLFKEQVGETVMNTLNKFRLEKASQLLTITSRQVAEIAEDVGFDCTDHFTRMFQTSYGITPSKYRKQKLMGL